MASFYESHNMKAIQEPQKASQACMSCRKQKRKCSKALPACSLCERMNRNCDYSDSSPLPTSEDFNALRRKVTELESRLNERNGGNVEMNQHAPYATPSSTLSAQQEMLPQAPVYTPPREAPWHGIQNRFPAIAFLDGEVFRYSGVLVPKPTVEVPLDALEILGDATARGAIITEYFSTVHRWMPIVSPKRLTQNIANPLWEPGPDLALLFLCMKLIISRPQDGIESSQNPVYISAKRFVAIMEATGAASLLVLQANLLVTWYEYGQAIYPAAWMSAGWCVRYGNMLGINGHEKAVELLGNPVTWTGREEQRRTWWGVLLADRVVSIGCHGYITNPQEPNRNDLLPVNDSAWAASEMSAALQQCVSAPLDGPFAPFPRLCQAYVLMGRAFFHHHGDQSSSESDHSRNASALYGDITALARKIADEAASSKDILSLAAPLALTFSTLCILYDPYSCSNGRTTNDPEALAMQLKAVEGLKSVSATIVDFAGQLSTATPQPQDLDKLSPIVMDALYVSASNNALLVRESGNESNQAALESLRHTLRRFGTRWRNSAEYLRILEAQEFTYAVGTQLGSATS